MYRLHIPSFNWTGRGTNVQYLSVWQLHFVYLTPKCVCISRIEVMKAKKQI